MSPHRQLVSWRFPAARRRSLRALLVALARHDWPLTIASTQFLLARRVEALFGPDRLCVTSKSRSTRLYELYRR